MILMMNPIQTQENLYKASSNSRIEMGLPSNNMNGNEVTL